MAEDKKNDEKIKVNVIKRSAVPQPQKTSAPEAEVETEKKHIVLKKKPTIVVKVKEKEEEKSPKAPAAADDRPLSESSRTAMGPKVIPYDKSKLPPINPEPRKPQQKAAPQEPKKDAFGKEPVVLTGMGFMTNTAVHHQNSRIQSPLHNGPVIIKSADLPPVPGQKVDGADGDAPHKPRVAGIVGGRPAGGYGRQGAPGQRRFQNNRQGAPFQRQGQGQRMPRPGQSYTPSGDRQPFRPGQRPGFGRPGFQRPAPGQGGPELNQKGPGKKPQAASRRKDYSDRYQKDEELDFQFQKKKREEQKLASVPKSIDIMESITVAPTAIFSPGTGTGERNASMSFSMPVVPLRSSSVLPMKGKADSGTRSFRLSIYANERESSSPEDLMLFSMAMISSAEGMSFMTMKPSPFSILVCMDIAFSSVKRSMNAAISEALESLIATVKP